jgi:amino acid adenylation domain-containing protein
MSPKAGAPATSLAGVPASPGVASGIVLVLNDPFSCVGKQLPKNAVVVAPIITPSLAYSLIGCAAIVTEIGGLASHGAIVAREMAIPAVVGVARARAILQTGMSVTVDGGEGEIKVPVVPASAAQQRLWFLYQLDPEDTSYNIPQAFRLRGSLDRDSLQESLNRIVMRHAALRTTFAVHDHLPVQQIHESMKIALPVVEISSKGPDSVDAVIQRSIDEHARRPFKLEQGPLIRAVLFRLSMDDHVLLIVEHHIVFDRTSEGLMLKELSAIYNHLTDGSSVVGPDLPDLPIQYDDYTKWRIDRNQDDALQSQLKYWKEKLQNVRPLELPTDRPRSKSISSRGERLYLELPAEAVDGIEVLSRKNGATMFMGLLAVFNVLVHHWTGGNDITIGTPFADRRLNGTKELLGFFVNNIILRTNVSEETNFLKLLGEVRKVCFGAYRHNSVPFEKLVEHLKPERQENRNPLFDVQFAYQKLHPGPLDLNAVSATHPTASKGTSQYDFTFTVREQPNGYDARIEYRMDLFDADTMTRLLRRFKDLVEVIVANPKVRLSEIPLLDEVEYDRIARDWNDTFVEYPSDKGVHRLFEEQVRRTPDAIAVSSGNENISYKELDLQANRLANFLRAKDFGTEDIAAICVERSIDMVIGLLAILKAGGAYLPLDRAYPNNRLSHMLDDSGAKILLTYSDLLDDLPDTSAMKVLIDVEEHEIERAGDKHPSVTVLGNNLAYVIYTSGSTGLPKGVQIEHHNVVNFLCTMREEPGLSSEDVLLAVTTLSFDISVLEIFLPLIVGARTVIAGYDVVIDGERINALLKSEQVTVMQATPVTWRMLIDAGWECEPSFRVLCGGEAMPKELAQALTRRSNHVWNMYGPTETTVWSTCFRITDAEAPLLIGRPIANTSIFVLDPQMRPVPVGQAGELFIGGDGVARGYLHRPELTAERFVSSPFDDDPESRLYATGDGVRYLPDGNIEYLNRLDNQIKVRGNRIELGEIQAAVVACRGVGRAVVIVREDDPGDPRIAAYYVLDSEYSLAVNDIRTQIRDSLPAYMIPQYFVEMESLPLTQNGKIDRKALPAPDLDALALTEEYRAPRTESEKSLAAIWQELLGLEKIGVHDNFVELGGHSLLALQAISRIKHQLGVSVSAMSMIMDTLEQIAAQFGGEDAVSDVHGSGGLQIGNINPLYFGPNNELFGLHHLPIGDRVRSSSVLICGPIYIESITAHWALKRLADQLSRMGYHVLRFDYFGSGDSLGGSREGNVKRWLEDIQTAAGQLKELSGIKQVSMVGLRFGATLVAMAEQVDVKDMVLWDPILSGEDYLAYMRDRHRTMIEFCDARRIKPVSQGKDELLGFYCPPEFQSTIKEAGIENLFEDRLQRVVMVTHEDSPSEQGRLTAFLPGASLRIISSEFSEQNR